MGNIHFCPLYTPQLNETRPQIVILELRPLCQIVSNYYELQKHGISLTKGRLQINDFLKLSILKVDKVIYY